MSNAYAGHNDRRWFRTVVFVLAILVFVAAATLAPAGAAEDVDQSLFNYRVEPYGGNDWYTGITLAEMVQGGPPEVLVGNRDDYTVEIWQYDEAADTLVKLSAIEFPYQVHDVKAANFDNDFDVDIVASLRFGGLYLARNTGAPGTASVWSVELIDPGYSWQVLVEDFDDDGHLDVFHGMDNGPIRTFYGDGAGNFAPGADVADPDTAMRFPRGFNAIDLNGDELLDLIGMDGAFMRAFLNPGSPAAEWESVGPGDPTGDYPCCDKWETQSNVSPSAADLDGDGYVDQVAFLGTPTSDGPLEIVLFAGSAAGGELAWTRTTLDHIFGDSEDISWAAHAGIADLNGDGYLDVHVGGGSRFNGLIVFLGDGEGDFFRQTLPIDHGVGDLNSFAVGDINGDGAADIVTSRYTKNNGSASGFEVLFGPRPRGGRLVRASERLGSGEADGNSWSPAISGDGRYVVFGSNAANLVGPPEGIFEGVFRFDRVSDRLAVIISDYQDSYLFERPDISNDGQFVAYEERNIDNGDGYTNIWLEDLESHQTILVGEKNVDADDDLIKPAISGDGRYVAFESAASNLVPDDANGADDIFLFDRETGDTVRVSLGVVDEIAAEGHDPSISADAQKILYETTSYFTGEYICPAIVLHNRATGETEVLAEDDCDDGNYTVREPALAASGKFAAYVESCSECAPEDIIDTIYVVGLDGQQGYSITNDDWWPEETFYPELASPSLSADGQLVAFTVEFQSNRPDAVYVYDHQDDTMTEVSAGIDNQPADGPSGQAAFAANGRAIVFESEASNLIASDTNGYSDVFVYDLGIVTAPVQPLGVLDAGEYHTCGLTPKGAAICWGASDPVDDHGQAEDRTGPFFQVGAGAIHSCGLLANGDVECWGGNQFGQAEDQAGPFTQLAVGGDHNCALKPDGHLTCWGRDQDRSASDQDGVFTQVSVGVFHTCGLTPAGDADCWGDNHYGQAADRQGPFIQVVTGYFHTCALRPTGEAVCWGDNLHGPAQNRPGPYTQLTAGYAHNCGLRPDNRVDCWGDVWFGAAEDQIGPYVQISAHYAHTCGLMPDGRVECWGWNADGQAENQPGPFGPYRPAFFLPFVRGH